MMHARPAELDALRDAVCRCLAAAWPEGALTPRPDLAERLPRLWASMAASGQTVIGHPESGFGIQAAVIAAMEHGVAGSPAAIIPSTIVNLACHTAAPDIVEAVQAGTLLPAIAYAAFDGDHAAGTARLAAGHLCGNLNFVEDVPVASHLVIFVDQGLAVIARSAAGLVATETPGLVRPAFHRLDLQDCPARLIPLPRDRLDDLARIARLLYAARALGAARRAFSLAVENAKTRRQFGKLLAQFQAMQHKLANCEIALQGSEAMLPHAAMLCDAGDDDWPLFAEAAIAFASSQLRQTSVETQHALGAMGYAEAHEAPAHFRRVHGDLCRMGGAHRAQAALFDAVRSRGALPGFWLGDGAEAYRARVKAWLAQNWDDAAQAEERGKPEAVRGLDPDFVRRLAQAGLLSASWPAEHGGENLGFLEQLALNEELEAAKAPYSLAVCISWLLAPLVISHGRPELQAEILPRARRGEIVAALGYSEPEAGSDLSNLKTRAVRDGDDYVITGQKLWGTLTEKATHILLAARTDPEAQPRRDGISLFVVPADLPGITIQPHMAFYGHSFCTQFYDDVRIPGWCLLGEENGGWPLLGSALASERVFMGGKVRKLAGIFGRILDHLGEQNDGRPGGGTAERIGALAAELLVARLFALRSIVALEDGRMPIVEGAISKVFSGELAERLSETAIDILGTGGLLGSEAADAPLGGLIEHELRTALMMVIGGGAAEIQRSIIAQQGLDLPR
jgi:alkylation response protein AidB-like acyl-CoA dehydrogenase